ncbi:MAG: hypothetical protein BAJATHORv1_40024 [Candidatus Thorarchaeota archaeon]|nr:MAG: hypothetical protein BAJATHORv1_40024 [Candidatus Thorarchaeota archaeon]
MTKKKLELLYDVSNYVLDHGDVADKLRLIAAGYDVSDSAVKEVVDELQKLMNPDGGIPFNVEKGNPSSVKDTAEILYLIVKIDGVDADLKSQMISFLVSRQKKDGGFAEALNLDDLIEDKWGGTTGREWYPVGVSITWLTGKALEALVLAGYDDTVRLRAARDFLLYSQHEDGHWPDYKGQEISDPLATGNILPALQVMGVNSDHKVYKDARAALLQHLKSSVETKSTLDMVDLLSVGEPKDDLEKRLMGTAVELIKESQNKDGGWSQLGSKKSDPELSSLLAYVVARVSI